MGSEQSRHCYVSEKFSLNNIGNFTKIIQPGDAIEFIRDRPYNHWGVYIGYRKHFGKKGHWIIHLSSPPGTTSSNVVLTSRSTNKRANNLGGMQLDLLEDVILHDLVRVNNRLEKQHTPLSQDQIVENALTAYHKHSYPEYHVINNNCEHFVNWCRYNKPKCAQVDDWISYGQVFLGITALIALALNQPIRS